MSAIQKELCKATEVDAPKKSADRQEFLLQLLRAVGKLNDAEWEKLSKAAQAWYNGAADARNAKAEELPDFPDLEDEAEEAPRRGKAQEEEPRRRGKADEDDAPTGTTEVDADDIEKGMVLRVLTKRGKDISGTVSEVDDAGFVLVMGNGEDADVTWKSLDKAFGLEKQKESASKGKSKDEDEDPIRKGVQVLLITKRGKEVTGEIVELDEEVVVVKDSDGEKHEFDRDRLESIKPVKSASAARGKAKDEDSEDEAPRRGKAKSEKDEGESKRSSNPEGVSIAARVAELMIENLDASEDEIGEMLKKEGVAYRGNTLNLNYKATKKLLDLLKKKKMLKV